MARNPKYQIHNLQSDGYGKLVQIIGDKYYDGFGNLLDVGSGGVGILGVTGPAGATGSIQFASGFESPSDLNWTYISTQNPSSGTIYGSNTAYIQPVDSELRMYANSYYYLLTTQISKGNATLAAETYDRIIYIGGF